MCYHSTHTVHHARSRLFCPVSIRSNIEWNIAFAGGQFNFRSSFGSYLSLRHLYVPNIVSGIALSAFVLFIYSDCGPVSKYRCNTVSIVPNNLCWVEPLGLSCQTKFDSPTYTQHLLASVLPIYSYLNSNAQINPNASIRWSEQKPRSCNEPNNHNMKMGLKPK